MLIIAKSGLLLLLYQTLLYRLLHPCSAEDSGMGGPENQGHCLVQKFASLNGHGSLDSRTLPVRLDLMRQPGPSVEPKSSKGWHDLMMKFRGWDVPDEPWKTRQIRAIKTLEQWVMQLRVFMICLAGTFVSIVSVITLNNVRTHWCLPRLQTAGAQLLLALATLCMFPSITSLTSHRVIWVLAFRYLTEGYATLLAMYIIPHVMGDYVDKALKSEKELKRRHIVHRITSLDVDEARKDPEDPAKLQEGEKQSTAEGPDVQVVTHKPQKAASKRGSSQEVLRPRKMVILDPAPLPLVFLLCCARPGLCIVRGVTSIIFHAVAGDVQLMIAVTFNVLNFVIILASLGLAWRLVRRTFKHLAEYVPQYQQLSMTVSVLPLLGGCQDLMVAWLYGAEGLGISFAGLLYLHEVVAVFGIVAWMTLAENQPVVQVRAIEEVGEPPRWGSFLLQLLDVSKTFYNSEAWPEYGERKAVKTLSVLCRWVLADFHLSFMKEKAGTVKICAPYQLTHLEEKWQQQGRLKVVTSWRKVFSDAFSTRVHSTLLTVSFLCIILDRAMALLGPATTFTMELNYQYSGGLILVMLQLAYALFAFFMGGICLLGNNVFMHRRWLITAVVFFFCQSVFWFRNFFLPPDYLAHDFTLLWRDFFRGCLALTGLVSAIRVVVSPEISSHFLQVEVTALRYTRSLFSGLLQHSVKKVKALRRVNSMARMYPPILVVSAVASIPIVMATAYYVIFSLTAYLNQVEELQVSMKLISEDVNEADGGTALLMATYDKDGDHKLSRSELEPIFRGLEAVSLREAGEDVFFLADAAGNHDGFLSAAECNKFASLLRQAHYAAMIIAGDGSPEAKAEKLLGLTGSKCIKPDKIEEIIRSAQKILSPGTPPLLSEEQVRNSVLGADADHDGCLSGNELKVFLGTMKADFEAKRAQVQALLATLSNPNPEALQQLAGQLAGLDFQKDGLDIGEAQPLVASLDLISPDAAAAVPKLFDLSDADFDGRLSTTGIPALKDVIASTQRGSAGIADLKANSMNAAQSAASAQAVKHLSRKLAQDAEKAAETLKKDAEALQAAQQGGGLQDLAAGVMNATGAAGVVPGLSLLQVGASARSDGKDAPINSTSSTLRDSHSPARSKPSLLEVGAGVGVGVLQVLSGQAVQPNSEFQEAHSLALQRMVEDSAVIAVKALEQIAAGEVDLYNLRYEAEAALEQIRRKSMTLLQEEHVNVSRADPKVVQPTQAPSLQSTKQKKKTPKNSPQARVSKEKPDVTGASKNAEVQIFVQRLAPYLRKAAEAAETLLTSLADEHKMAQVILRNYDSNKDKVITKEELVKALTPAVAPLYPFLSARQLASGVLLPGLVDTNRNRRLEEVELEHVAQLLSTGFAKAFGDVNGDGSTDSQDLLAAAKRFTSVTHSRTAFQQQKVHNLGSRAGSTSLLDVGLHRGAYIKKASFIRVAVRQKFGEVASPDADVFPAWLTDYTNQMDDGLMQIPVSRLKATILISGVLSLAFTGYILHTAFRGYHWMFVQMQTGSHQYKGNRSAGNDGGRNILQNQFGNSTLFVGMLMSTMVCGWLGTFFLIWVVLSALMFFKLWLTLWQCKMLVMFLIASKLIKILLRVFVMDRVLNENGYVTWPITFSCVWVVLMILNFAIGLLASVCRFFLLLPMLVYRFNTLDDTMMPEIGVGLDCGYYSLLSLTYTSYEQMNPICRSFISSLSGTAHRLYGPSFKTAAEVRNWDHEPISSSSSEDVIEPAPAEVVKRANRRRVIRNKLWLATLLVKNPSLKSHRRYDHPQGPQVESSKEEDRPQQSRSFITMRSMMAA